MIHGPTTSQGSRPLYAFYGHHKCATMTMNAIIGAVCRRLGLTFTVVFDEFQFGKNLNEYIGVEGTDFLSYGNADIAFVRQLPDHRGFHIIRDPRDIVVSAYFSHLHSHSTAKWHELEDHRKKLKSLSLEEGLAEEIIFRRRSFEHMASWDYGQPNIIEIRFEDFIRGNYDTLLQVFSFIGLLNTEPLQVYQRILSIYRDLAAYAARKLRWPQLARLGSQTLSAPELLTITWRNSFQAKSKGRSTGESDHRSHYRKGKSGDWNEYFSNSHKALFKELYPGLIPQLHYHPNDDW